MKPKHLYIEAAENIFSDNTIAVVGSPERLRYEAAEAAFKARLTPLIDRAQVVNPHNEDLSFNEEAVTQHKGPIKLEITKREVLLNVLAGEDFDNLIGNIGTVYKRITIGVHDLKFRDLKGEPQETESKSASCDILTELYVDDATVRDRDMDVDSMFSDFQVLERMNWQHPVYNKHAPFGESPMGWHNGPTQRAVDESIQRVSVKGWESNFGGMQAALDELEALLRAYPY